jgi:hypothetical protein
MELYEVLIAGMEDIISSLDNFNKATAQNYGASPLCSYTEAKISRVMKSMVLSILSRLYELTNTKRTEKEEKYLLLGSYKSSKPITPPPPTHEFGKYIVENLAPICEKCNTLMLNAQESTDRFFSEWFTLEMGDSLGMLLSLVRLVVMSYPELEPESWKAAR